MTCSFREKDSDGLVWVFFHQKVYGHYFEDAAVLIFPSQSSIFQLLFFSGAGPGSTRTALQRVFYGLAQLLDQMASSCRGENSREISREISQAVGVRGFIEVGSGVRHVSTFFVLSCTKVCTAAQSAATPPPPRPRVLQHP